MTVSFLRDGRWPKESSNLAYLEVNNGKLDKDLPWDFENETRDERARVVFALEEDDGFLEWKDKIPPKVYRPLGCVWMETEKSPQQDQTKRLDKEIKNEALSAALQTKTVFSQQELDNLKLGTLSDGSFIKVQDRCFEPAETVEDVYEPFLIQQGFIMRTPRGRVATDAAWSHLGIKPPDKASESSSNLFS